MFLIESVETTILNYLYYMRSIGIALNNSLDIADKLLDDTSEYGAGKHGFSSVLFYKPLSDWNNEHSNTLGKSNRINVLFKEIEQLWRMKNPEISKMADDRLRDFEIESKNKKFIKIVSAMLQLSNLLSKAVPQYSKEILRTANEVNNSFKQWFLKRDEVEKFAKQFTADKHADLRSSPAPAKVDTIKTQQAMQAQDMVNQILSHLDKNLAHELRKQLQGRDKPLQWLMQELKRRGIS